MQNAAQLDALTPLMRQYYEIKNRYADALVLFQVGDFYELFFDDAKVAAHCLGIALTQRGKSQGEPIPLCGVPIHAVDHYIPRLIKAGFKVALCDQLEEPQPGKVVERGVTQVLTPGTLIETKLLDAKSANYLVAFYPHADGWAFLVGELLTAQLYATMLNAKSDKVLETELTRFFPDEIILRSEHAKEFGRFFKEHGYFTSLVEKQDQTQAHSWLQQFNPKVQSQVATYAPLSGAFTLMHDYLRKTQEHALAQFSHIQFYEPDDFLKLDAATQKNLELIKNNHDGSCANTLFSVLDQAITPMGSRMIKKWILRPLMHANGIESRLEVVNFFVSSISARKKLEQYLKNCGDLERIIGRIGLRRAHLHDFIALKRALSSLPLIKDQVLHTPIELLKIYASAIADFSLIYQRLEQALEEPNESGRIIKKGCNQELDTVRELIEQSTKKIIELELKEQSATGINSLKIRYTNTFGYYIEITKTHLRSVPERYIRKQTLVGRERFTTPELQALEQNLAIALKDSNRIEQEIFEQLKSQVMTVISPLRKTAHALAQLDALIGFARAAYEYGYVRPDLAPSHDIAIEWGRHPVIARTIGEKFIANSVALCDAQSLWIITGPNMGGKSTFLRQTALIALMTHIGSFVPAKKASIPLLDRIFTRIGAGDNLAEGKSTFLVEMEETAAICTLATQRSLVILDEVGRGTSTFDGLAIAQAVIEYIHTTVKARCLFATHYHELSRLPADNPGIASYYVASKKTAHGIVFLYTITPGVADGSFGLEVAKLAQLPSEVINRAREILQTLKVSEGNSSPKLPLQDTPIKTIPDSRYEELERSIRSINWNQLSPKAAFDLLWELKDKVG